jgi:hypothetical protein
LPALNKSLKQKKLPELQPLKRSQWDAATAEGGVPGGAGSHMFWERD